MWRLKYRRKWFRKLRKISYQWTSKNFYIKTKASDRYMEYPQNQVSDKSAVSPLNGIRAQAVTKKINQQFRNSSIWLSKNWSGHVHWCYKQNQWSSFYFLLKLTRRTALPDLVALEETLLKYGFPLNQQLPIVHNSYLTNSASPSVSPRTPRAEKEARERSQGAGGGWWFAYFITGRQLVNKRH